MSQHREMLTELGRVNLLAIKTAGRLGKPLSVDDVAISSRRWVEVGDREGAAAKDPWKRYGHT